MIEFILHGSFKLSFININVPDGIILLTIDVTLAATLHEDVVHNCHLVTTFAETLQNSKIVTEE